MAIGSVNVPGNAVPQHSNPNLLDNGYFLDPINQRGQTVYSSVAYAGTYTIDRWRIRHESTITIVPDGIKISGDLYQYIDRFKWLSNKTVTLSLLIHSVVGQMRAHIAYRNSSGEYTVAALGNASSGLLLTITCTFPDLNDATECFIRIFSYTVDSTCIVQAAKLELGSRQTLAHQDADGNWVLNDPPPDKALELAKCQRYYQTSVVQNTAVRTNLGASHIDHTIPLRVQMRAIPTITMYTPSANNAEKDKVIVSNGLVKENVSVDKAYTAGISTDRFNVSYVVPSDMDIKDTFTLSGKYEASADL